MEKRSCFNCMKTDVCFVFRNVKSDTNLIGCNIDGDATPGKWTDIFIAIGKCCLRYVPKKTK